MSIGRTWLVRLRDVPEGLLRSIICFVIYLLVVFIARRSRRHRVARRSPRLPEGLRI